MYKCFFFLSLSPPLPLKGLVEGLCFIFYSVYISESFIVFLSVFLWLFPSDLLSLFPSLLVGLLPKLVPGLGEQPSSASLGRGYGGEQAE